MKRFIAVLLAFVMLFSFAVNSYAAVTESVIFGSGVAAIVSYYVPKIIELKDNFWENWLIPHVNGTYRDPEELKQIVISSGFGDSYIATYYPETSSQVGGYYIDLNGRHPNLSQGNCYIAGNVLTDGYGVYHFKDLEPNSANLEAIIVFVDGTTVTYFLWEKGYSSYYMHVTDYSIDFTLNKLYQYLSNINGALYDIKSNTSGSGGSIDIDTSEMESLLSSIDSDLSQVLPYLSALNSNIIDIENYVDSLSGYLEEQNIRMGKITSSLSNLDSYFDLVAEALVNLRSDLETVDHDIYGCYVQLEEINAKITECTEQTNAILNTIATDVGEIKGDVSDIEEILNSTLPELEKLLAEITTKLDSDVSAADLENIDTLMTQVVELLTSLDGSVTNNGEYLSGLNTTLETVSSALDTAISRLNGIGNLLTAIKSQDLFTIRTKFTESMDLCNSILDTISGDIGQIKDDVSESKGILATIRDKIDGFQRAVIGKLDDLISAVRNIGGGSSGSDGSSFVSDLLGGIFGVAFEALKLLLNLIFNLLSSVFGWIARFSAFVASFWTGFIPAKTLSVLLIIPPLSLVLGVVKFVRG